MKIGDCTFNKTSLTSLTITKGKAYYNTKVYNINKKGNFKMICTQKVRHFLIKFILGYI